MFSYDPTHRSLEYLDLDSVEATKNVHSLRQITAITGAPIWDGAPSWSSHIFRRVFKGTYSSNGGKSRCRNSAYAVLLSLPGKINGPTEFCLTTATQTLSLNSYWKWVLIILWGFSASHACRFCMFTNAVTYEAGLVHGQNEPGKIWLCFCHLQEPSAEIHPLGIIFQHQILYACGVVRIQPCKV